MTVSNPTVSVVLPVKNPHPEYFPAAVASILRQTHQNLELLIIEAPSVRSASPQLARFDDVRIRRIELPAPTSLVAQLNHGVEQSQAPLVARMDADDVACVNRIEKQRQFLEQHPEVDVVGSQLEVIDESGTTVGVRIYPRTHEAILSAMRRFNPMAHPAVMFRRQAILDAGGYRYPERAAQDYELWSRLAIGGSRFANLEEHLLLYRLHPDAIKVARLRDTLRSTLETKRTYWSETMTWSDRGRMWLERMALHAPASLVFWAFQKNAYRTGTTKNARG